MSNNWINSNLERFTIDKNVGKLTYSGIGKIFCKVCDKEIQSDDIVMPFPSSTLVEGIAHKRCMEKVEN